MEDKYDTHGTILLNNGLTIPRIGFGTYQIRKKLELEKIMKKAYETGFSRIIAAGNFALMNELVPIPRIRRVGVVRRAISNVRQYPNNLSCVAVKTRWRRLQIPRV